MMQSDGDPGPAGGGAVPVHAVGAEELDSVLQTLHGRERRFALAQGFKAEAGRHVAVPDAEGGIARILFGLGQPDAAERGPLLLGKLATALPPGDYRLAGTPAAPELAALAFALGGYRFERYRKPKDKSARLVLPEGADAASVERIREGVFLARDLINTPANDLSPHDLASAARALADRFGASIAVVDGEALERGFPMIHAVGAGSDRQPCLIDLRWGWEADPKVTLVGKGIVSTPAGSTSSRRAAWP